MDSEEHNRTSDLAAGSNGTINGLPSGQQFLPAGMASFVRPTQFGQQPPTGLSQQFPGQQQQRSYQSTHHLSSSDALLSQLLQQQQAFATQMLNQQQEFMRQQQEMFLRTMSSLSVQVPSNPEVILDSLSHHIKEFRYDPENNITFAAWYARYKDLFEQDASRLDSDAKVRLFLRKMGSAEHERYVNFILPKLPKDYQFDETVRKLGILFGAAESLTSKRYRCLQTTKKSTEDYVSFSCRVNKNVVDFELSKLTEEQFKCLLFVCGLKAECDAEIVSSGNSSSGNRNAACRPSGIGSSLTNEGELNEAVSSLHGGYPAGRKISNRSEVPVIVFLVHGKRTTQWQRWCGSFLILLLRSEDLQAGAVSGSSPAGRKISDRSEVPGTCKAYHPMSAMAEAASSC
ncbi:uncharacterized protein LOC129742468 [Uranotaenia lowii]|uniref:uncharacterized protein LOC129742468 n=1 Tax=Uranotaenia lowii TaxID=190385 RepID=UPI00247ACCC0|nr:uncharacterized protein LOC129742468 [Uranotaenia lowii]